MKKGAVFFNKKHKGQVWIETVMYTLIAFVMIGLVLAFARPKIQELQDKALIEQSITILKEIESTILNMGDCSGNQRIFEVEIKKGNLKIDGVNDKLIFEIESAYTYSEPGENINDGNLIISTQTIGDLNNVSLTRDYSSSYNLKYGGVDEIETLTPSSTAYNLLLKNEGTDANSKTIINITII